MQGHFVSAPPRSPSLVVIHEFWGLNGHIKGVADRFARDGFSVLAIDLYGGKVAPNADAAMQLMTALDRPAAVAQIGQAREELERRDPGTKVGVLGFCMGGALALASAAAHPFAACVQFYGIGAVPDVTKIRGKVLGHFATQDSWCTPASVDALEQKLTAAKVDFTFHRYAADHAFFNDTRPEVYSAANAQRAWDRTIAFLKGALT